MKRTISILRFIKKHRSQKKKKLYRLAFGVAIDTTIFIYLGLFSVLFLFVLYDQLQQLEPLFQQFEWMIENGMSWIIIAVVARSLVISNYDPGIRITSAEYKLSSLPYTIKQIWNILFIEKGIRLTISMTLFFIFLFLLTPFTLSFILKVYFIILVSTLLVILPQWYFHSLQGMKRWMVYFSGLVVVAVLRLFVITQIVQDGFIISLVILALLLLQFLLYPKRFAKVSWAQIAEMNDQKVWNMLIIRFMSDTKGKPTQRKSVLKDVYQRVKMRKPFQYSRPTHIYRRIWLKGLHDHMEYAMMILFYFAICVILTSLKGDIIQGLGLVGAMFMFVKMVGSLFHTAFQHPLVLSIPWNTRDLKASYMFFVHFSTIILLVIVTIALWIGKGISLNLLWYIICFACALYLLCDFQLTHHLKRMNDRWYAATAIDQLLTLLVYVSLFFSILNVKFLLISLLIIIIGNFKKKLPINN